MGRRMIDECIGPSEALLRKARSCSLRMTNQFGGVCGAAEAAPFQNTSALYFALRLTRTSALSTSRRVQQAPGGMGAPWGQARGWPRKAQMRSVASGER